jgi:hypothetical protein
MWRHRAPQTLSKAAGRPATSTTKEVKHRIVHTDYLRVYDAVSLLLNDCSCCSVLPAAASLLSCCSAACLLCTLAQELAVSAVRCDQ